MKEKKYVTIIANSVIIFVLIVLFAATLSGNSAIEVLNKGKKEAVYRGDEKKAEVSLMINVYWGTEYVLPMAKIFEAYGYNTTFFLGGSWLSENIDMVVELDKLGFELANHGYNHKNHKSLSVEENRKELMVTNNVLCKIIGRQPVKLFAPPSGYIGENMMNVCEKEGFEVIMWSRDTIDWRDKDSNIIYSRAIKNMKNGDLILMHPTAHSLEALPNILNYCKQNGFKVVTVSQNINSLV
ncbi:MAG: polysaccharide deacetylase family protein [Clostridia bacterium]